MVFYKKKSTGRKTVNSMEQTNGVFRLTDIQEFYL